MFSDLDLEGQIGYVKGLRNAAAKAHRNVPLLLDAGHEMARYHAAKYARLYAATLMLLADHLDPIAYPPECWDDKLDDIDLELDEQFRDA
jgi:hypothetical protein